MQDFDLGPLPIEDRYSIRARKSIRLLQGKLKEKLFICRFGREHDFGVDARIELRHGDSPTNICADVQIKAVDGKRSQFRNDGSFAYGVETSNLNYLLHGDSPLYIIYIESKNDLRYAWARDEARRIETENPKWRQQRSVVLRFATTLAGGARQAIYRRILEEGRLQRKINDRMSRADRTHVVPLHARDMKLLDPAEARSLVEGLGYVLSRRGEYARLSELLEIMGAENRSEPKILMVRAYAEHARNRFDLCLGHLTDLMLQPEGLSQKDLELVAILRDDCDYRLGTITAEEAKRRLKEAEASGDGERAVSARITYLARDWMEETDAEKRDEVIARLREAVSSAMKDDDFSAATRLQARIYLFHAEGSVMLSAFTNSVALLHARIFARSVARSVSDFGDTFRTLMAWLENGKSLILEARELVCPQLIGEAILTQAQILFIYLESSRLQIGSDNQERARAVCSRLLPQLEHAVGLFQLASNVEFELRAMLLIADFQEILGERAKAVAIARSVLPRAEALRIENLARDARAYIDGVPFHRAREREFLESKALDIDLKIAVEAEANLPKLAKHFMAANDLPEGRYPMVLRECQAMRDEAKERVAWCEHIHLIQDLRHVRSVTTAFAVDPERWGQCDKHGHTSLIPSVEWNPVLKAFKGTYCVGCPDRKPLEAPG